MMVSLGMHKFITISTSRFLSSATACSIVRGNPSRRSDEPFLIASTASAMTILIMMLSGTSAPSFAYGVGIEGWHIYLVLKMKEESRNR